MLINFQTQELKVLKEDSNKKMAYERDYHKFVHKNLLNNKEYYLFRAKYAEKTYLKHFNKTDKILEFGCGVGQNIFLRKENSIGIDISDFCIEECKKRDIKVNKKIESIKSSSIDGVISIHCLEHVENPDYYIKEFYRILKKDGKLIVVLPNIPRNRPEKIFTPNVAQHFFSWRFHEFNELLNHNNFNIKLNKFNYAYGFSLFYRLPFKLSLFLIKLFGYLKNRKEMIIVAQK